MAAGRRRAARELSRTNGAALLCAPSSRHLRSWLRTLSLLRVALFFIGASCCAAPAYAEAPLKVLHYAFSNAETGFDPAQVSDLYSRAVTTNVFDGLYRYAYLAKPGTIEPNTADGMPQTSSDYKTFVVKLKRGIVFADDPAFNGKPRELTAQDYVYSFKRIADPRWKSPSWSGFETLDVLGLNALRASALKTGKFDYDTEIEGLKALDRYTLRIKLGQASPRFVDGLADGGTLGAVAREVIERYGDDVMAHPVGTGPFKLVEWRRSSRIVLERNPRYREETFNGEPDASDAHAAQIARQLQGLRMPMIDRVEIDIVSESQPRWLAFLNAQHDFLERMPLDLAPIALPNGQPSPTLLKKQVQVERRSLLDVAYLVYNMDDPTIGGYTEERIALRRALNLAFDAPEFVRNLFKGHAAIAQSNIAPQTYGYDPNLRTEMGETDPDRANALLDTYGYVDRDGDGWRDQPNGKPLTLTFSTQPEQASRIIDEILKKSLDRIHVRVDFRIGPWAEQAKAARAGQFMIWALGSVAASPDSSGMMRTAFSGAIGSQNLSRFKNAEYDALYLDQDRMPDGPERLAKIRRLQKLLIVNAPMKFGAHRYAIDMAYPWVKHYTRWPFMQDWWRYVDVDVEQQRNGAKR